VTDDPSPRPALTDLAFHILIALGSGSAHGYAVGKDVEEQSGGRLDPSTGTLYQALHRLKEDGLIASVERRSVRMNGVSTSS
jgi:DNA-binding PadR family transcriptional regulator